MIMLSFTQSVDANARGLSWPRVKCEVQPHTVVGLAAQLKMIGFSTS